MKRAPSVLRAFLAVSALATVALVRQTWRLGSSRPRGDLDHPQKVHPSALPVDRLSRSSHRRSDKGQNTRRNNSAVANSTQFLATGAASDDAAEENNAPVQKSAHHMHQHANTNNATQRIDEDEPPALQLSISSDDATVLGEVAPEFISTTMDWWSKSTEGWGNSSVLNADLTNQHLITAAQGLRPFFLRIGGSQADEIVYHMPAANDTEAARKELKVQCKRNKSKCLTRERWDEVLEFVSKIGARMVFTLAYVRQTRDGEGNNDARDWDSANARRFLEYTVNTKHAQSGLLYGFELGNELRHKGKIKSVSRIVRAYEELRSMVDEIWDSEERKHYPKPKIMGPASTGKEETSKMVKALGRHLDIVSYHKYHGGGKDANLPVYAQRPDHFLHPVRLAGTGEAVEEWMANNTLQPELWIGEGAMAHGSGRAGVTDSWVGSLWFANLLGALAKTKPFAHSVYCRQAMTGGFYELITHETLVPNPDYWVAYVWKKLVGTKAIGPIHSPHREDSPYLSSRVTFGCCDQPGNDSILVHSFCAKESNGNVVFVVINIDASKTIQLLVNMGGNRTEYVLSPNEEGCQSREVRLNGRSLRIKDGRLPKVRGMVRPNSERVEVPPLSIAFLVVQVGVNECRPLSLAVKE